MSRGSSPASCAASLVGELNADYVRTARSKGLRERDIVGRHVMRNALLPFVTIVGLMMANFIGGAVVTEAVFTYPGLGRLLIQAISTRDYPLIQGCILVILVALYRHQHHRGRALCLYRPADRLCLMRMPLLRTSGRPPFRPHRTGGARHRRVARARLGHGASARGRRRALSSSTAATRGPCKPRRDALRAGASWRGNRARST